MIKVLNEVIHSEYPYVTGVSFDFTHDGSYDSREILSVISDVLEDNDCYLEGLDFESAEQSYYPERGDRVVSICSFDLSSETYRLDMAALMDHISDALFDHFGFTVLGYDVYTVSDEYTYKDVYWIDEEEYENED